MIKPIQILSDLINTTAHTVNVSSIVDNLDNTYTLLVDNTYYLHDNSKVTINSIEYTVKSFILNDTLLLSGATVPVVTDFVLDSPLFVHGTPKKINGELSNKQVNQYPIIWLLEFMDAEYNDSNDSAITAVLDLNIFFLTDINFPDWDVQQHYTGAIDPMSNEISFIIKVIKKRRDLFGELESHKVTNHVNFGEYITNEGYDKQILSDQLSGCQLRLNLPYAIALCDNESVIVSKCLAVTITENNIFKEYVQSGGTFNYSSTAGGNATQIINNSLGATLYTNIIASGTSATQVINDSTNTLNGGAISGIVAQGNKAVTLKDDLGATITPTILTNSITNLDLEIPAVVVCGDATEIINDSNGTNLHTDVIASGGTNTRVITDSTITNSDASYNDVVLAQGNKTLPDIANVDSDGTTVNTPAQTPFVATLCVGTTPLNSSELNKSGATTSFQTNDDGDKKFGSGVDFYTLSYNNKFGNTSRFTDDLGTQLYATDVVVDWSTFNQVTDTVLCYYRTPETNTTLTNQLSAQPHTKNSLSGWYMANPKQITNLFNYSVLRDYLNYAPFNISTTSTNDRLWTSFRESATVGVWYGGFTVSISSQGSSYRALLRRIYTLTELGL